MSRRRATVPALVPTLLLVLSIVVLLSACGGGGGPGGGSRTVTLDVFPTEGPPGTPLEVTGFEGEQVGDEVRAFLGEMPVPFLVHEDGTLTSSVPLYPGDGEWPAPPAQPQVLELRVGDTVLARSGEGVRVTELARAPGSARAVAEAVAEIAAGTERMLELLPSDGARDEALRDAAVAMLDGVAGGGENSLQAVAAGTAPLLNGEDIALAEALLASSGTVAFYQDLAAGATAAGAGLSTQALGGLCEEEGPDADLACLMQVHTVLVDYAEIVVKPTAYAYAHTVGLATGYLSAHAVALPGAAAAGLLGSLLGIADFAMNKVVPGMLPSTLSRFDLVIPDATIEIGEETVSTLTVAAVNDPPDISVADMAELLLSSVGLKSLDGLEAARQAALEVAKFGIDLFYKVLREVESISPGTFPDLDADHLHVPNDTWGPVQVTNERLVRLFSEDDGVVAPLPEGEGLEWRAVDLGTATVRAQTRGAGATAKLLRDHALCLGCVYAGGAFGLDAASGSVPVKVGSVILTASPRTGPAPLSTTFTWQELEPQDAPLTCTLDPGDGSDPITVEDCAVTTTAGHTYAATSRLQSAAGVYEAVLSVDGTKVAVAEVNVGWTFDASPRQGDAPLDVGFSWSGLDASGQAPSCSLDPGDGSAVRQLGDCAAVATAQHRYAEEGSYQATLLVEGGAFEDYRVVSVTVGDPTVECDYLADVELGWIATYDMAYADSDSYVDNVDAVHEGSFDVQADVQVRYDDSHAIDGGSWSSADVDPVTGSVSVESQVSETLTNGMTRTESVTNAAISQGGATFLDFDTEACTYAIDIRIGAVAEASATSFDGRTSSGTVNVSPGWLMLDPMPLPASLADFPIQGSRTVPARPQSSGGCADCFLFVPGTTATYVINVARDFPEYYGNASVSWSIAPIEP